jgi:biotin-(acetyl-CoA carboxylase) ligase
MNEQFDFIKSSSFDFLKNEYESHLFQMNELKKYKDDFGEFFGKIIGTTDDGKLVIEKSNTIVTYALKEVAFL